MKSVTRKAPVEPANQRGVQHDLRRQNIIAAAEKLFEAVMSRRASAPFECTPPVPSRPR